MKAFSLPVTLDGAARKKDDSVSLRFVTTFEITTEDYMEIDRKRNQTGWLVFSPNPIEDTEIPKEVVTSDKKSKSQRLRASLYVLYKQNHPDGLDADAWVDRAMEKIIQDVQEKLDD